MENKDLKAKYDEMHKQGSSAWFCDGKEERELILKMGEPWPGWILEIGCGEGDLASMIAQKNVYVQAIDYSKTAILKAQKKYTENKFLRFYNLDYRKITNDYSRIVMQGVLEHLDDPF